MLNQSAMSRKRKTSNIYNLFHDTDDSFTKKCCICELDIRIKPRINSNLHTHLKLHHGEIYSEWQLKEHSESCQIQSSKVRPILNVS